METVVWFGLVWFGQSVIRGQARSVGWSAYAVKSSFSISLGKNKTEN
jgi:hypothetical protein